jgi:hypothetical protein
MPGGGCASTDAISTFDYAEGATFLAARTRYHALIDRK